jgi:uncharacterized SAM-binding protein YcdF (DUF218 family)
MPPEFFFFDRMGIPSNRIEYEGASRNTEENAVLSLKIAGSSAQTKRWVLITSAMHMPRAIGTFRKVGWNVIAFPVDYRTDGNFKIGPVFSPISGFDALNAVTREWMGLIAYRILGRSSALFPAPGFETDN